MNYARGILTIHSLSCVLTVWQPITPGLGFAKVGKPDEEFVGCFHISNFAFIGNSDFYDNMQQRLPNCVQHNNKKLR